MGAFPRFLNCINGTKSREPSHSIKNGKKGAPHFLYECEMYGIYLGPHLWEGIRYSAK